MKKERWSLKKTLIILITIVILVIILYFSKKSYCSPSGYLPESEEDINSKEIQEFFKSSDKEILCVGSDEKLNKIFSGKTSYIICRTSSERGQYSLEITKVNALKATSLEVNSWFMDRQWEGPPLAIALFPIKIPEGINDEFLRIEIVIRKNSQLISTENLNFEIDIPKPLMKKICRS